MEVSQMPRLKIIFIPPGTSPDWIRAAWVGLELEYCEIVTNAERFPAGVVTPPVYAVDSVKALQVLKQHNPDAHQWYADNRPNLQETHFAVVAACAELIGEPASLEQV